MEEALLFLFKIVGKMYQGQALTSKEVDKLFSPGWHFGLDEKKYHFDEGDGEEED